MSEPLTYKSVLPAITIQFQDNKFLDVDDVVGFTLSKTDDHIPMGIAVVDIRFGKRMWHAIKSIWINGQPGRLVQFERYGHSFELFDDIDEEAEEGQEEPYDFAKLIIKYEMSDDEMIDILSRRPMEIDFVPDGEGEEDESETEDSSTVLQCGEDTPPTD